jgi:hypothetical protein
MFDFTAENNTNEGDFPKFSTGEFPVFSGPVRVRFGRTGTGLPDRFQRCHPYWQTNTNDVFLCK